MAKCELHINDSLLNFYQSNGTTKNHIGDAAYEFLQVNGAEGNHIGDMWNDYLTKLGYEGHINDMLYDFWNDLAEQVVEI